jgi:hypothetical protein
MSVFTAVIVEPRKHSALAFVLKNMATLLPDGWKILVFHGNTNGEFVQDIINEMEFPSRFLKPISLDVDNLTSVQYNAMLMSSAFYKCIPTETMLIFQTDTMILEPTYLTGFLSYDYVGAPWRKSGEVGNGGLSVRKRTKMLTICQTVLPCQVNEDVYFSMQPIIPLFKPSFQEAQKFAVETVFYEQPFGIHAPWKHLNEHEMGILLERYPAIQQLMDLQ